MGCKSSKLGGAIDLRKHGSHPKTRRESSSSSPAPAESHKKAGNSGKLRIDALHCESMSKDWVKNFKIQDGGDLMTVDMVLKDALSLLRTWPRGELAGQLLTKPELSNTPLKDRGIKLTWLLGAWQHMTSTTQRHLISTRMFVELFVRPILVGEGIEGITLFDFIPPAFRATPNLYVSHPWDGYFRHLLFYPETLKKSWPADSAVWMDIFALPQLDDGPNSDRLNQVKETLHAIGRTVVVFPGDGTPQFALLPAMRSWCIFEMLNTPVNMVDFRVGLHGDLNDLDFHEGVVQLIDSLTVQSASTSFVSDKRAIEAALAANDLTNTQLRTLARSAFAKRYEGVPTSPHLSNRLSNGSRTSRGRMDSMSDIYAITDERKSDEGKLPDF